ncbi:MAG: quinone-dependent dihydroorotate dehydrogenase [Gammaproteobacteria bacterium]|nr:quinone-dependent dihydroorotate dehydrogenase [Gammaproteobacteria bacterium]MBU3989208.1 quinone-dependent dihydroorotate dehydrogenase [Gammaproteobacteria bacterium]MBU4004309.1 quinone-dependent dihydroorotate dehydrogenase [Gammaproteobacteria bacterium]MBU4019718.1 quinone-dependent dihydroorotate dehydrogenase [Gammaproteobacteria bacterium]MBU4095117.1 quinone-dependent dihydroorotate dehydrogenase [Gammaproteobacteria bacterium]
MLPYCLVKPFVLALDPETAHEMSIAALRALGKSPFAPAGHPLTDTPTRVMGIDFPNRIGLAAGLDKNGEAIDGLAGWGFGFIEIGTVTPRPQPGNPKPRMFRLPQVEGIINRMGFNNHGIDALIANVRAARFKGVLGINIGKNADTPIENAAADYLIGLEKAYLFASYITVNISSPNTKNLRALQDETELDALLGALKARQTELAQQHGRHVPLALKIAPDLDDAQIGTIAAALRRHRIEAVIATNTTLDRSKVNGQPNAAEAGGLSGAPLFEASTQVVRKLAAALAGEVPIIAAGGVVDGAKAKAKLDAGAELVQIYSGLVYRGPDLVKECVAATRTVAH